MFSTTPEIAASAPSYAARSKQPQSEPAPSDGFAALIDNAAPVAPDDRGPPPPVQPQRVDSDTRSTDRRDAPNTKNDSKQSTTAPRDAKDNSVPNGKSTNQSTPAEKTAASGHAPAKNDGTVKTSSDDKKHRDKAKDVTPDTSTPASAAVAVDPNAVAVAVPLTTDATSAAVADTPTANPAAAAIEAIAGASAPAATNAAEKTDPSAAIAGDASTNEAAKTPTAATTTTTAAAAETKLTAAASAEVATLSTPEAEVAAAGVATATTTQAQAPGKAKTAGVQGKPAASGKDDDKQVIETSAPSEHAVESSKATKTTADTEPTTEKSAADKTDSTQDKATTSSDASDSSNASAKASNTSTIEHRAPTIAPANLPLQPDPSVFAANNLLQPLQLNTPNVAAMPAQHLTAAVLTADAPVPLDGLAADIALRAAGGNSRFEIRLDPAELGRIDVRLDVDKHGQVTSHLTVERPATLDMLRRDAPQLQQALEDAGLKTGDSGLQFSLRDQSSSGQQNDNGSGRQSQRLVITEENTVPAQAAGRSYGRMLGSSGGVDIRV